MTDAIPPSLSRFLPEPVLGATTAVTPIHLGLSGAGVFAVTTDRGEYVLRVQDPGTSAHEWTRQLRVLRRVAEHGVGPAIMYVDETAHAVVSARIVGVPLTAALADPAQRDAAVAGVIAQLRALHAIDPAGIEHVDPVAHARAAWEAQRQRPGFPIWASQLNDVFDAAATLLARDARQVVSHNDLNPGNILWDGARAWLVDWAVAGLTHPFYDIATFTTFLNMDIDAAFGLLAAQEQRPLDDSARGTLATLRRLVALAAGCVFLGLVPDLTILGAPTRDDAPTLADFYAQLRTGTIALSTPLGRGAFGHALLRVGTAAARNEASS